MGRPRKQTAESETALPLESLVNDGLQTESEQEKEKTEGQVELVKMYRSDDWPEPHTANVHPDEVKNFVVDGWLVLKE